MSSYAAGIVNDIPAVVEHLPTLRPVVDRLAAAPCYEHYAGRQEAFDIVRGLLGRHYHRIRRRMVERQLARNSPGSAR